MSVTSQFSDDEQSKPNCGKIAPVLIVANLVVGTITATVIAIAPF